MFDPGPPPSLTPYFHSLVLIDNELYLLGHTSSFAEPQKHSGASSPPTTTTLVDNSSVQSPFGNHEGLLGIVNTNTGRLCTLSTTAPLKPQFSTFQLSNDPDDTPPLSALATTSSGVVTAVFLASPAANTIHLACFSTLSQFHAWHADPSNATHTANLTHHMLPGKFHQLVANATSFTLLTREGAVYTWGDARYAHTLGRNAQQGWGKPGVVEALGGLRVTKVCSGGFLTGVITEADDAYILGGWGPEVTADLNEREDRKGVDLLGDDTEMDNGLVRIHLPDFTSSHDDVIPASEEEDSHDGGVTDLAIGRNHILVLSSTGHIWSAGVGDNGQLGTGPLPSQDEGSSSHGEKVMFSPTWKRIEDGDEESWNEKKILSIACGDLSSFVIVASKAAAL